VRSLHGPIITSLIREAAGIELTSIHPPSSSNSPELHSTFHWLWMCFGGENSVLILSKENLKRIEAEMTKPLHQTGLSYVLHLTGLIAFGKRRLIGCRTIGCAKCRFTRICSGDDFLFDEILVQVIFSPFNFHHFHAPPLGGSILINNLLFICREVK
jgi:hypothetical protein